MNDVLIRKPTCTDNFKVISPGLVGSVGDVNMATRMRTSNAAIFPVMFDVSAARLEKMGSDIQDGDSISQVNGGGYPASVKDMNWNVKQSTRVDVGDRWQDVRQNNRLVEPIIVGSSQYSFKNQVAHVEQAKVTGDRFLPLPGGYEAGSIVTRGGLYPSVISQENTMVEPQRDKMGNVLSGLLMAPKPVIQDTTIKQPIMPPKSTPVVSNPRPTLLGPSPSSASPQTPADFFSAAMRR